MDKSKSLGFPSATIKICTDLTELTRIVAGEVVKRIKEALALVFANQPVFSFLSRITLTYTSRPKNM